MVYLNSEYEILKCRIIVKNIVTIINIVFHVINSVIF